MIDYKIWFKLKDTKYQINSKQIYADLSPQIRDRIAQNQSISEIIQWLSDETKRRFKQVTKQSKPTDGALNNATGRWNEFIVMTQLYEAAIDLSGRKKLCIAIFPLPNSTIQTKNTSALNLPKFLELFNPRSTESLHSKGSGIFFPSPDCVVSIIHNKNLTQKVAALMEEQIKQPGSTHMFKYLKKKLDFAEVRSVISLKTSNRPDRRYQPSFEAAMIKALGQQIGQPWKYYMVTNEYNKADALLFEHLSTPTSIINGQHSRLVDDFLVYQRKADLLPLLEAAIT